MVIKLRTLVGEEYRPDNIIYRSEEVLPTGSELSCRIELYNEDFRATRILEEPSVLRVIDENTLELWSDKKVIRTLKGEIINEGQEMGSNSEWIFYRVLESKLPVSQDLRIWFQRAKNIATLGFTNRYYSESKLIWEASTKERE